MHSSFNKSGMSQPLIAIGSTFGLLHILACDDHDGIRFEAGMSVSKVRHHQNEVVIE